MIMKFLITFNNRLHTSNRVTSLLVICCHPYFNITQLHTIENQAELKIQKNLISKDTCIWIMPRTGIQYFGSLQYGTGDLTSSLSALSLVGLVDFTVKGVGLGPEPPGMARCFVFEPSAFSSALTG